MYLLSRRSLQKPENVARTLVQVILDSNGICAPESLKVQLTKLLTLNNVLYCNLPLPTQVYPDYAKLLKGGKIEKLVQNLE